MHGAWCMCWKDEAWRRWVEEKEGVRGKMRLMETSALDLHGDSEDTA